MSDALNEFTDADVEEIVRCLWPPTVYYSFRQLLRNNMPLLPLPSHISGDDTHSLGR